MLVTGYRFVVEVDPVGREENKNQNQRDHDVIVQRATLIRPENVAPNCAPHGVHWQGRRARGGRTDFCSLQVFGLCKSSDGKRSWQWQGSFWPLANSQKPQAKSSSP